MKQTTILITCNIILLTSIIFTGCKKSGDEEWGIPTVYMPQAALRDGGRTNNYPVPWSTGTGTQNYVIDSVKNTIDIFLGVYRAGLKETKGFSVDVVTKIDTTNKLISNGTLTNAVLLPPDAYTLPSAVTVAEGQREAVFYLKIDRKKLVDKYAAYSGKRLVLAVGITKPSNYELNTSLTTTIIIIDSKVVY